MFSLIFDRVDYYASKSSVKNTLSFLEGLDVKNVCSRTICYAKPIKSRLYYILTIVNAVLLLLKSNKNDVIYFNTNPLWAVRMINYMSRLMCRTVIINLHSELEFLQSDQKLNPISQHELEYMFSDRFPISKTLYYCCLGDKIRENLLAIVPANIGEHVLSFGHTCIFRDTVAVKSNESSCYKIKIGITGSINDIKSNFSDLIYFVKGLSQNSNIEVYAMGRVYCDPAILERHNIKYPPHATTRHLSRSEINGLMGEMDFIVYLYSSSSYRLTASGALFDAIDAQRMILATCNDYFTDLFENRAKAGLLFDDIDSIIDFLNSDKSWTQPDYKYIKQRLSPQTEAALFGEKLRLANII